MAEPRGRVHHIDLTVADPDASFAFYDAVLDFMGYRCADRDAHGIDWHLGTAGKGFSSIGIVRAEGAQAAQRHDRHAPGLHHLALHAQGRDDVDALHRLLVKIGATVLDAPAEYPQYGAGYYAVFFADPDGLKLEYAYWP